MSAPVTNKKEDREWDPELHLQMGLYREDLGWLVSNYNVSTRKIIFSPCFGCNCSPMCNTQVERHHYPVHFAWYLG